MSATAAQPSNAPAMTGTYQRGRARSRISQTAITGTEVPMWSGDDSRMFTPDASCGASMMPTAMSTRATAWRPVEVPLASNAANSTASV